MATPNKNGTRLIIPEIITVAKWLDENRDKVHMKAHYTQMTTRCRRETGIDVSLTSMHKFCKEAGIESKFSASKLVNGSQPTEGKSKVDQAILDRIRDVERKLNDLSKMQERLNGVIARVSHLYEELDLREVL